MNLGSSGEASCAGSSVSSPSSDRVQALDGLSHRHTLTCQDVHAFGGFLLHFHSRGSHEVVLLLVSFIYHEILILSANTVSSPDDLFQKA